MSKSVEEQIESLKAVARSEGMNVLAMAIEKVAPEEYNMVAGWTDLDSGDAEAMLSGFLQQYSPKDRYKIISNLFVELC